MPDTPVTTAQFREVQGAEYGEYVAAAPIDINGARAFNTGDPVPVSHVKNKVVTEDQVKKITTQSGRAAVAATTEPKG